MGIPRHPYEGCTYCFIHEEAHTYVRFLSCDGHQLYERGVDLEVEGVRYIQGCRFGTMEPQVVPEGLVWCQERIFWCQIIHVG